MLVRALKGKVVYLLLLLEEYRSTLDINSAPENNLIIHVNGIPRKKRKSSDLTALH